MQRQKDNIFFYKDDQDNIIDENGQVLLNIEVNEEPLLLDIVTNITYTWV
jgi:hypothetical protein